MPDTYTLHDDENEMKVTENQTNMHFSTDMFAQANLEKASI